MQFVDAGAQFGDGVGYQKLRFGEGVGIFEVLVLQPGDVEVEVPLFDLRVRELPEAAFFAAVRPFAASVGVDAVASLEILEHGGDEGAVFFGDAGNVGPAVVYPGVFGFQPLLKEDHVGLHSLAVGGEGAVGKAQQGVDVAVFHKVFDDVARGVGEEDVVGQHHGRASSLFEYGDDVLNEVELFVAGGDGEVVTHGSLVCPFGSEGGIGEDAVVPFAPVGFVDAVAQVDSRLQSVEKEVHQGESSGARDEFLSVVGGFFDARDIFSVQGSFGDVHEPFVGDHQEARGSAGGVADGVLFVCSGVGAHDVDDGLYEHARGEVLPRSLLSLGGGFFQQSFEGRALDVDLHGGPVLFVDHVDDLFQVDRIGEPGDGLGEDVAQEAGLSAERPQNPGEGVQQLGSRLFDEGRPGAVEHDFVFVLFVLDAGEVDVLFVRHLEEHQVGQLFDIVAVVDSVMAKGVAEAPEFVYDVGHGSIPFL